MTYNKAYNIFIACSILLIWYWVYSASKAEYDVNYFYAFYAFVYSALLFVFIVILWFSSREFIRRNKMSTILFLVLSSPISLIVFYQMYLQFCGPFLKGS